MPKVLIADDSSLMRAFVQLELAKLMPDLTLLSAATGRETLGKWRSERPDVVVLDLHMPETDGTVVLRAIHAADRGTQVIVFTACRSPAIQRTCRRLGARDVIVKSHGDVVAAVQNVFRQRVAQ